MGFHCVRGRQLTGFANDGYIRRLVSPAAGPAEAGPRKAVLRGVGSLGSGSILSPRKSVLFSWELWSLAVCDSDC